MLVNGEWPKEVMTWSYQILTMAHMKKRRVLWRCHDGPTVAASGRPNLWSSYVTGWGPPDINWFINHYNPHENYSYIYHKPLLSHL